MGKTYTKRSQVSPRTVWTIGINVLAMAAIFLFIYFTKEIFILLLAALVLTGAINPIIVWLERKGWRRGHAVLAFFGLALVLFAVVMISFIPIFKDQAVSLISSAPQYIERLQETSFFKSIDARFHVSEMIERDFKKYGSDIGLFFFGFLASFFKGAFAIVSIIVLTIFMLIFGEEILGRGLILLGRNRFYYLQLLKRMQRSVGGYVIGTLVVATIGGVVIIITLLILGVPYFLPLGVIMIIFGLIPYIGPIIAAVAIVGITLVSTDVKSAIIITIVFLTYQQVENHLLQPLVQRRTIKMNPLLIIIAMFLGTSLAGIVGAILALPVAGAIQILFRGFVPTPEPKPGDVSTPK